MELSELRVLLFSTIWYKVPHKLIFWSQQMLLKKPEIKPDQESQNPLQKLWNIEKNFSFLLNI